MSKRETETEEQRQRERDRESEREQEREHYYGKFEHTSKDRGILKNDP